MPPLDLAPIVRQLRGNVGPDPRANRMARQLLKMAVLDLSTYKPVPATLADANQIANGMQAIQNVVNAIDNLNFASGKIFDLTKLMQGGASTGQFLKWDGTNWAAGNAGSTLKVAYIFNGTTSYTPTSGATKLFAECTGAGASGGGVAAPTAGGTWFAGGGGSGGYSAKWCTTFTAGAITVAVGAGGAAPAAGANNGNAGGDTSFDTASANVVAKGGAGGIGAGGAGAFLGGAGGLASGGVGDAKADGARGDIGTNFKGGAGGSSRYGAGGQISAVLAGGGTAAGTAGSLYGGGGQGAVANNPGAANSGGAGANGLLIVWEFSG